MQPLAGREGRAYRCEGCAIAGCRQATRVAVGQNACAICQQWRAMIADCMAHRHIFGVHRLGFPQQPASQIIRRNISGEFGITEQPISCPT
jgi:hypothetical protein